MRRFFPVALLIATAGLTRASIIESISLDLSALHSGSTLSGTFTLPNVPIVGDTASALLSFSDPGDYTPTSLMTTITIGTGTPSGFAVTFAPLLFTNPSGNSFTTNVDLTVSGQAQCASFPCSTTGGFEDGSPATFRASYTVSPVAAPEPGYGLLLPLLIAGLVVVRNRRQPLMR